MSEEAIWKFYEEFQNLMVIVHITLRKIIYHGVFKENVVHAGIGIVKSQIFSLFLDLLEHALMKLIERTYNHICYWSSEVLF